MNNFEKPPRGPTTDGADKEVEAPGREKRDASYYKIEGLINLIENYPDLDNFKNRAQEVRGRHIDQYGLAPEATGQEITSAYEGVYASKLTERARVIDQEAIDGFLSTTTEREVLPLAVRQELLNTFLREANKLFRNKAGQLVSMAEYLKDYYGHFGIDFKVKFGFLPEAGKQEVLERLKKTIPSITEEELDDLKNDKIAIPLLTIKHEDSEETFPIIASKLENVIVTARWSELIATFEEAERRFGRGAGPRSRELKQSFMGISVLHVPEFASTLNKISCGLIHEIDHAVRKLGAGQRVFDREDRMISEGTAELARDHFCQIQALHDPGLGYDYERVMQFAVAAHGEGKGVSLPGQEKVENKVILRNTYASGLILTRQTREGLGDEAFWELMYNPDNTIISADLARLRNQIEVQIGGHKAEFKEFIEKTWR